MKTGLQRGFIVVLSSWRHEINLGAVSILLLAYLVMGSGCEIGLQRISAAEVASASSPETSRLPPAPPETGVSVGATNQTQDFPDGDDLGSQVLLRRLPHPRMFRVYSDTQYLYDSNALLVNGDFIPSAADEVLIQTFGVSFSPPILEHLQTSVYWRNDLVRYNQLTQFDFDYNIAGLRLGYPIKDWFELYSAFSGAYYTLRTEGEFYKYFEGQLGLFRKQPLNRRVLLYYGYEFDGRLASPSSLTRLDNALYLGVNLALIDRLTAECFYRIRVRSYLDTDRTDLDNLLNLTLTYAFNRYISARLYTTYGHNTSSVQGGSYGVFNGGGGLNLSWKF